MGGNLFKLGRLPREAYLVLEADLRVYLDQRFGDQYLIPRYYGDKPDFGDVDIVLSSEAIETTWEELKAGLMADLGVTQCTSTGAVFSTVWRDFQVDYFVKEQRYFRSTYNFLCYNDLGNLLGKIFRRMNLKYGEKGLQYVFRRSDEGSYKRDLMVSQDMGRILGLLELDVADWEAGFEDLDQMYRWVVSSPWFSARPYLDPSRTTRSRIKSRPTMTKFLTWLAENPQPEDRRTLEDRDDALPMVCAAFPEAKLMEVIAAEEALEARAADVRSKFSGKKVMAMFPELRGQELGEFIRTFKDRFEDFEAEISALSADVVEVAVRAHYAAANWRSTSRR